MTSKNYKDYMVILSDRKEYCFYPTTSYDFITNKASRLKFKIRTVVSVQDEDWKTAIAQNKESIPPNTELEVIDVFTNYYGRWLEVKYNNSLYYINPLKVEYVGAKRC